MNKLAKYIGNHGLEKSAGVLDKVRGLFRRAPEALAEPGAMEAALSLLKRDQELLGLARKRDVGFTAPPMTGFRENLDIGQGLRQKVKDIAHLTSEGDRRRSSFTDSLALTNKDRAPLRLYAQAAAEARAPIKVRRQSFDFAPKELEVPYAESPGHKITTYSKKTSYSPAELEPGEALKRHAHNEIVNILGSQLGHPDAQALHLAFTGPETPSSKKIKDAFLNDYLTRVSEGKPAFVSFKGAAGHPGVHVEIPNPYSAGEVESKSFFGAGAKDLRHKLHNALTESEKKLSNPNLKDDELSALDAAHSRLENFRDSFRAPMEAGRDIELGDLSGGRNSKQMRRLSDLLHAPLAQHGLDDREVSRVLAQVDAHARKHKVPVQDALKDLLGKGLASPEIAPQGGLDAFENPMRHLNENDNLIRRLNDKLRFRRLNNDETQHIVKTVREAKDKPASEGLRLAKDLGSLGVLGGAAALLPYAYFKDDESKPRTLRRVK